MFKTGWYELIASIEEQLKNAGADVKPAGECKACQQGKCGASRTGNRL